MKVLVTGGAGFIGSHIVEELVKMGEEVVVIDNLSSGKLENIKEFENKLRFVKGDIRSLDLLKKEFKGVDFILHQAALKSVHLSFDHPEEYNEVNVDGTLNILKAAKECDVKKVIFASSSSVYGESKVFPQKENSIPNPKSPYAASKLEGERLCKEYSKKGLETVSLRYFNVFGPRQDPKSEYANVIPKFIGLIMANRIPIIYEDGKQSRDFIYVKNVADTNIKACKENVDGEVINIGCGEGITINQLSDKINKILRKDIKAKYEKPRPGDVRHTMADVSKQRELLKLELRYDFDKGLRETVEWFNKNKKIFLGFFC